MSSTTTANDTFRTEGYAWGTFLGAGHEWLTVAGSARRPVPLTVNAEDAPEPGHATVVNGTAVPDVLARVERVSDTAFRVMEVVRERRNA